MCMKEAVIRSSPVTFTIIIGALFFGLAATAFAKDDPILAEKLCRNEVIRKYRVDNSGVKVIYRGDDGGGHHIVNFDVFLAASKTTTGICLVRQRDGAIELKEFIDFPNKN